MVPYPESAGFTVVSVESDRSSQTPASKQLPARAGSLPVSEETRQDTAMRVFECAGKTYRMTRQRRAVLDVLMNSTARLDALGVYEEVRQVTPHISFGTVLRTLSLLREAGFITEPRPGGNIPVIPETNGSPGGSPGGLAPRPGANASRDASYEIQCQTLCLRCGRTITATLNTPVDLKEQAQVVTGFAITDHHLELRGLCPDCA
jgi:Fe2+ or Zn2+ uptake regulation protein